MCSNENIMSTENKTSGGFKYRKSYKIVGWGCRFDSLTELKYAISIRDEWVFLRERVVIYYNPGKLEPTNQLVSNYRYYAPDFLIRHKETGEAFLVEIKPRAFEGHPQLALRQELAEKFIKWKGYDWKFKIVYDDEIILSSEQLEDFEQCCKLKSTSAYKIWFDQMNRKYSHDASSLIKFTPDKGQVEFAVFGTSRQK